MAIARLVQRARLFSCPAVLGFLVLGLPTAYADPASDLQLIPSYARALGPLGPYAPGMWSAVEFDVVNPTDQRVELTSVVYFADAAGRQYCRRISVPPRSRRTAQIPVRMPQVAAGVERIEAKSLLLDRSQGAEVALSDATGALVQTGNLAITHDRLVTGVIADAEDVDVQGMVLAMRKAMNMSSDIVHLDGTQMSRRPLETFDCLALSTDVLATHGGLPALRQWLLAGGRLWIALDEIGEDSLAALLGESDDFHRVDRVDLTDVALVAADRPASQEEVGRPLKAPVELVRVILGGGSPTHFVAGWPAAFTQQVGEGTVFITTLSSKAWLVDAETSSEPDDAANLSNQANEPLAALAGMFLQARSDPPLPDEQFQSFVSQLIGYKIVDRALVGTLLLGFCSFILGTSLWLRRRGCPEHLAWIGSAAAIVIAGVFFVVGHNSRRQLSSMVAAGQFVQTHVDAEQAHVTGLLGMYWRDLYTGAVGARDAMRLQFADGKSASQALRMVWTDAEEYHWENLAFAAGLHVARCEATLRLSEAISAQAILGPDGLEGVVQAAPFVELSDAIIATPAGNHLACRLGEGGAFSAGASDRLASRQYIAANVLTDEQRSRAEMYAHLLERDEQPYPRRPYLLAWAQPAPLPLDFSPATPLQGAALLAVPLILKHATPDSKVQIPAAFLPFQSVAIGAEPASTAYDNGKRQWIGPLTRGGKIAIRFQLPPEVLPVRLTRAELHLQIQAPKRVVSVAGLRGDDPLPIKSLSSPSGRIQCDIDAPEQLAVDEQGGLRLLIDVGRRSDEQLATAAVAGWSIEELRLDAFGVALAPTYEDARADID